MKGEFICKAKRITKTHPLAYQMGDIKDIEDYKQKIEKQQKLRKKTIKAVREHFNLEDMDYLEKELMQNIRLPEPEPIKEITVQPEQKTEPKAKQDFEPKVKTSISQGQYLNLPMNATNGICKTGVFALKIERG